MVYAYLKSSAPPIGAFSPIFIPLLNIPASGIRLRPEFTTVCDFAGIPTSNIPNLDDVRAGFKRPENTRWILVDHNKLQGYLGIQYSQYVHGVIDHHIEENAVPFATTSEPRIVETAGSCTSQVVRFCRPIWDSISDMSFSSGAGHAQGEFAVNDSAFTRGWDAQLAKLALASVLIDTANLTAPGKVEEVDRQAAKYLEAKIQLSAKDAKTWNRDQFYHEIEEAKANIEPLILEEILIKDYKEWEQDGKKLGISSAVKPLAFLVQKCVEQGSSSSFEDILENFIADRGLSIFAVMTAFKSEEGNFQRELLLQACDSASAYAEHFTEVANTALKLKPLELNVTRQTDPSSRQPWTNFWSQGDSTQSRKQVAPMLRDALKE